MAAQVLSGRYRIVRHLARGGMAEVYLGHDQLLDRPVAVKVLFPELARDSSFVERFRREAQSAARLNHPNIVSVYDFGEDHGESHADYFIVMEYVAGQTLRDIIRAEAPLTPTRAIDIAADIAAGLAVAHGEGIIHRDVKPANVLISAGVAKVADFGIARAADSRGDLTNPGAVMGTATYISPEQAQGLAVDQRSDLYSLGMVLYEMLTGRAPFRADSAGSVAYKQQREIPPPPSTDNPAVPPQLDAVVGRAMSFDPADRQGSAEELRGELLAVGHGPVGEAPSAPVGSGATGTTAMLPLAPAGNGSSDAGSRDPRVLARGVYRRRRLAAVGLVFVLLAGVIMAVVALSSSSKATAIVPRVVGLPVADAMETLRQAGLSSRVVEQKRPGARGAVLDQVPAAGTRVSRSTTVSLVVRSVTTPTSAPSPSGTKPSTRPPTTTTKTSPTTLAPPGRTAPTTSAPTITTVPSTAAPSTTVPSTTPTPHP